MQRPALVGGVAPSRSSSSRSLKRTCEDWAPPWGSPAGSGGFSGSQGTTPEEGESSLLHESEKRWAGGSRDIVRAVLSGVGRAESPREVTPRPRQQAYGGGHPTKHCGHQKAAKSGRLSSVSVEESPLAVLRNQRIESVPLNVTPPALVNVTLTLKPGAVTFLDSIRPLDATRIFLGRTEGDLL